MDNILDESLKLKYELIKKEIVNGKKKRSKRFIDLPKKTKKKLLKN